MKKQLYELDEATQILILFWTPTNTQLVIELHSSSVYIAVYKE